MQVLENLPPIVGLILGLVLLAWAVFAFLVPFMIESIRQSARKTHAELVALNEKMDRLTAALRETSARSTTGSAAGSGGSAASPAAGAAEQSPAASPAGPERRAAAARGQSRPAQGADSERGARGESRGRREPTISETDLEQWKTPGRRGPNSK